jgi:hypothetical protein
MGKKGIKNNFQNNNLQSNNKKLKIEQHEPQYKPKVNLDTLDG